jgi:hypothetical protein
MMLEMDADWFNSILQPTRNDCLETFCRQLQEACAISFASILLHDWSRSQMTSSVIMRSPLTLPGSCSASSRRSYLFFLVD